MCARCNDVTQFLLGDCTGASAGIFASGAAQTTVVTTCNSEDRPLGCYSSHCRDGQCVVSSRDGGPVCGSSLVPGPSYTGHQLRHTYASAKCAKCNGERSYDDGVCVPMIDHCPPGESDNEVKKCRQGTGYPYCGEDGKLYETQACASCHKQTKPSCSLRYGKHAVCNNNGCITELKEGSKVVGCKCTCRTGWSGHNCNERDKCAGQSCSSQGVCNPNTGACFCDAGYSGLSCQTHDECHGEDCSNRGTCLASNGQCKCDPGWQGESCAIQDKCYGVSCSGRGKCDQQSGRCTCLAGWSGDTCGTNIDECKLTTEPCSGQGSCVDEIGDFTCQCKPGYSGARCETKVTSAPTASPTAELSRCEGVTCSSTGGACNPGTGLCACKAGYTGTRCEKRMCTGCQILQGECIHRSSGVCVPSDEDGLCPNHPDVFACDEEGNPKLPKTTAAPTIASTTSPTSSPTASPTSSPTVSPTGSPTLSPAVSPSHSPTVSPSHLPTVSPSHSPTVSPTDSPTGSPMLLPSQSPSARPTNFPITPPPSSSPSQRPTSRPSQGPTLAPTLLPTTAKDCHFVFSQCTTACEPSMNRTVIVEQKPTAGGKACPTLLDIPDCAPGDGNCPTVNPTNHPTTGPTIHPTIQPSPSPTSAPAAPSKSPSLHPTSAAAMPGQFRLCAVEDTGATALTCNAGERCFIDEGANKFVCRPDDHATITVIASVSPVIGLDEFKEIRPSIAEQIHLITGQVPTEVAAWSARDRRQQDNASARNVTVSSISIVFTVGRPEMDSVYCTIRKLASSGALAAALTPVFVQKLQRTISVVSVMHTGCGDGCNCLPATEIVSTAAPTSLATGLDQVECGGIARADPDKCPVAKCMSDDKYPSGCKRVTRYTIDYRGNCCPIMCHLEDRATGLVCVPMDHVEINGSSDDTDASGDNGKSSILLIVIIVLLLLLLLAAVAAAIFWRKRQSGGNGDESEPDSFGECFSSPGFGWRLISPTIQYVTSKVCFLPDDRCYG